MSFQTRLGIAILGFALPLVTLAAPASVTGIKATLENGAVRVSWTRLNDPGIVTYRIYFSHASILGNSGQYDDFESVDASVTSHVLTSLPQGNEVFVSVLAVNNMGEESLYFAEEAMVRLGTDQAQPSSSAAPVLPVQASSAPAAAASSTPAAMQGGSELRLLSAEAVSATGVVLHFSHAVVIAPEQAPTAIVIMTGSGDILQLRRFIIEGSTVTVHTETQERSTVYQIIVSPVITGTDAGGQTVYMADDQMPVLFSGHETGIAPVPSSSPMQEKADVLQLKLRAQPDSASTYGVEATWQAPASSGLTGYSIAQTTDGGATYSNPRMVAPATNAIKIPGVPAGQFGILVKAIYADGMQSKGASQAIMLPALSGSVNADVTATGGLTDSGPALWVALVIAGAVAGVWRMKSKEIAFAR